MPKLLRPYIPLDLRCRVAMRQLGLSPDKIDNDIEACRAFGPLLSYSLRSLSSKIGATSPLHLDHDPALENRQKTFNREGRHVGYLPGANDVDFLIYREKHAHHIKTNVRGDHGQFADNVIAKRERKRLRKLQRRKVNTSDIKPTNKLWFKVAKLKWPKGRKLQGRNTLRRS